MAMEQLMNVLGMDSEPEGQEGLSPLERAAGEYQNAAMTTQEVTENLPPTVGPSALKTPESMGMPKSHWLARGGLGNTIMDSFKGFLTGSNLARQKEKYRAMQKAGFVGARKLYNDALKRYPPNQFDSEGIKAWVPPPEYFIKGDGSFDMAKCHLAFQLGLLNYKKNLIQLGKDQLSQERESRLSARQAGQYTPEQAEAIRKFREWEAQNPGKKASERSAAWNQLNPNVEPPPQIMAEWRGVPTEKMEYQRESKRISQEAYFEFMKNLKRSSTGSSKEYKDAQAIDDYMAYARMRAGLQEDLAEIDQRAQAYAPYIKDPQYKKLHQQELERMKYIETQIKNLDTRMASVMNRYSKWFSDEDVASFENMTGKTIKKSATPSPEIPTLGEEAAILGESESISAQPTQSATLPPRTITVGGQTIKVNIKKQR